MFKLGLSLLFIATITSYSATAELLPDKETFEERYSTKAVDAKGVELVSFRRGLALSPLAIERLSAILPRHTTGALCFSMTTRDANYSGQQNYQIKEPSEGPNALQLKTKYSKELGAYDPNDFGIRAEIRENCDAGLPGKIVPTAFDGQFLSSVLVVGVNTKMAAAQVDIVDDAGKSLANALCTKFQSGSSRAYDRECVLNLPQAYWSQAKLLQVITTGVTGTYLKDKFNIDLGN